MVRDDKRRIKTDAKLTNQLAICFLVARQLLHKGGGARLCDSAEVIHDLIPRHANPVIINSDGLCLTVRFNSDPVVTHSRTQVRIADDRKTMLINGVGSI